MNHTTVPKHQCTNKANTNNKERSVIFQKLTGTGSRKEPDTTRLTLSMKCRPRKDMVLRCRCLRGILSLSIYPHSQMTFGIFQT